MYDNIIRLICSIATYFLKHTQFYPFAICFLFTG